MIKMADKRKATIVFIDIMNSSEYANILSLEEYDKKVIREFQEKADLIINHNIKKYKYQHDEYEIYIAGDEARVFLYSYQKDNISCTINIAVQLKFIWLMSNLNQERLNEDKIPEDLGIGINTGHVMYDSGKKKIEGYAINLAKRLETESRAGKYFKIFVSRSTFEECISNEKVSFGDRMLLEVKGISQPIPAYEIKLYQDFDSLLDFPEKINRIDLEMYAQKANDKSPYDIWIGNFLIQSYSSKGEYNKVISVGENLFKFHKDVPAIPHLISKAYKERGREGNLEKAKYWIEEALRISPNDSSILKDLNQIKGKLAGIL